MVGAGFVVVNTQPVKSEMSVATPKSQAKAPIQLDIIVVCRKANGQRSASHAEAIFSANAKLARLEKIGLKLSDNDRKIVIHGQLLMTLPGWRAEMASETALRPTL